MSVSANHSLLLMSQIKPMPILTKFCNKLIFCVFSIQ